MDKSLQLTQDAIQASYMFTVAMNDRNLDLLWDMNSQEQLWP
jgi:hypothetical protein